MRKRIIAIIISSVLFTGYSRAQSFIQPNSGQKWPETLVINKVEATSKATTFFLTVENRITGGTFCADKNIYLNFPDGTRSKLVSSNGIPVCPDSYKFRETGEKLDFTLTFPPLKKGVTWADLIEDCSDNCFYFYGITLDNDLNQRINNAFSLAENGENVKAMISFIDILTETDSGNPGVEGLLYINIINLARESGSTAQAAEWYKKLKLSGAPRLAGYIKYLNDQGIKY